MVLTWLLVFVSDVLLSRIWHEASELQDQSLLRLVPGLLHLQPRSRALSIVTMYKSGWLRWWKWASSKIGIPLIPAKPLHIALFITELTKICVENNMGASPIEAALYRIRKCHTMAGMESFPWLVINSWSHCRRSEKEAGSSSAA